MKRNISYCQDYLARNTLQSVYTDVYSGTRPTSCDFMLTAPKSNITKAKRKEIPVFFAADNNYLPFLDVTLLSVKEHASKNYIYKIYVLHSGINGKKAEEIMRHACEDFQIAFVNVEEYLQDVQQYFRLRDYYTSAIYYRLFIVGMFPNLDKALYLDCDIVALSDVAELYNTELGSAYVGAVADQVVGAEPIFKDYTKRALGVDGEKYFNSGVITLNLKQLRKINFYEKFYAMLKSYDFRVAPDQDCLNVLCKGRVRYFSEVWNRMPQAVAEQSGAPEPKLIHYNLSKKPWHYTDVPYQDHFWKYAKQSAFYKEILHHLNSFTKDKAEKDMQAGKALLQLAKTEAESEQNYYSLYLKKVSK